jgi:iron complex outermembrane receptor protein
VHEFTHTSINMHFCCGVRRCPNLVLISSGRSWFLFFLLALGNGGEAQQVSAQTGPAALKSLTLEQLAQIEVTTPSKAPVKAFQTAAAVYVITENDIRRSGVTTIPEALRLAPGVEVSRIDANQWSVGIRGFGTRLARSVLVLIDGRTVYTPLFAGTYWEVQDTLLEDIDRIEVIRGPGGTIWGPNAVNGVINIITKTSKETQGVLASAGGGNVEQGFANFRYGGGAGKNLTYRVYGKTFTRGPEEHRDGHNFDDWRAVQSGFRMDWRANDRDSLTFQGDLYTADAGQQVQTVTYTPPYSRIVESNAELSGGNVMGRWQRTTRNGGELSVQTYYDRTRRYEANLGETRDTFDVDFVHHLPMRARQEISWGAGARFSHANDAEIVSGLTFVPTQRTDYLYTAFVQDEVSLIERRLSVILGTKVLRTNFTGFELEPSARVLWTPSDRQTIWAAFTHAVRTPSDVEENFYLSGFAGFTPSGLPLMARFNANRDFAPEELNGVELGYRRLLGDRLMIDTAAFYNHHHNLFDQEITGSPFLEESPAPTHFLLPAQFRNGLIGITKGVEIVPEWRPAEFWRLRGSYSYLHMSIWKAPHSGDIGTGPGIVGSSPQHEVSIQSSFDLSKSLQTDLTYRYVSALPGQGVRAYSTGNVRFAWRFSREFELALVGRNLLQPSHAEFGGGVELKRDAFLKLTWRR